MSALLFFIILLVFFCLTVIIGVILWSRENNPGLSFTGKSIAEWSSRLFLVTMTLTMIAKEGLLRSDYKLSESQSLWENYNIPQIDSTMIMTYKTEDIDNYQSYSDDSILHIRKRVKYDVFSVLSIEDHFLNRKEKIQLTMTFVTPGYFRDSSWTYKINYYRTRDLADRLIDRSEFMKILSNWGLGDKLNKKFNFK